MLSWLGRMNWDWGDMILLVNKDINKEDIVSVQDLCWSAKIVLSLRAAALNVPVFMLNSVRLQMLGCLSKNLY